MKRIKIKPYPNFKLTDAVMSEIKNNSSEGQNDIHIEEELLTFLFNDGNCRMLKSSIVENNNHDKFITITPNLISIYIDIMCENYDKSENIKNISFINCGKKANKQINGEYYVLDADSDETHHCYNEYIKYKIISIIFSITTLESYINYILPSDYIFNKKDVIWIQRNAKFEKDKLEKIIPDIINNNNYWITKKEIKDKIVKIYNLRNKIIHSKPFEDKQFDNFKDYSDIFKELIKIDLKEHIENIIFFINDIHFAIKKEKFIEYSNDEYISVVNTDKIDYDFIKNYLNTSNSEMHKYFNESKATIKKWEHNEIPKDKKDFFINKEGENINSYLKLLSNKYYI